MIVFLVLNKMEKKERKKKHLYILVSFFINNTKIFTMLSHFEHEILLQPCLPTMFPTIVNDDNYHSFEDVSYCHNYQEEEEEGLMVKEEEINGKANEKKKKRKRRIIRMKSSEEVEKQRMTHIEVERNRRKQMNQHLHVLRSLMPTSYVQRVYTKFYKFRSFF